MQCMSNIALPARYMHYQLLHNVHAHTTHTSAAATSCQACIDCGDIVVYACSKAIHSRSYHTTAASRGAVISSKTPAIKLLGLRCGLLHWLAQSHPERPPSWPRGHQPPCRMIACSSAQETPENTQTHCEAAIFIFHSNASLSQLSLNTNRQMLQRYKPADTTWCCSSALHAWLQLLCCLFTGW
jgi:hypothetical protein